MVVATVHRRPMAKDGDVARPCATAPRPTAWMPTGRFSRAPCAPWQKEIRSVPQRGSCRWTKTPRWVSLASDPLVLPHQRGHEPLPTPKPTRDTGSLHTWRSVTPAMAMATPIMSGRPVHGCPIASRQHAWIDGVPSSTCPCIGISFITAVEGHYQKSGHPWSHRERCAQAHAAGLQRLCRPFYACRLIAQGTSTTCSPLIEHHVGLPPNP